MTSPPYWGLRDYGIHDQAGAIGLEETLDDHLDAMVRVFREVRRVLRPDGTLWLNYGDAYAAAAGPRPPNLPHGYGKRENARPTKPPRATGFKPKDLMGLPWRIAFALQEDGWWLRSDIVWHKPNPMPESALDRPTKAHEYVFLLAPSERYFYDAEAIKEEASEATHARIRQKTFLQQTGGPKDPKDGNRSRRRALENLARKAGVGPKTVKVPSGWAQGEGAHETPPHNKQDGHGRRHAGVPTSVESGVASSVAKRPRNNESFQEATASLVVPFRNKRSVWTVPTQPVSEAHFATFPEALVEPCILAGTSEKGACATCGAPIERVTDTSYETLRDKGAWAWRQQADAGLNRSAAMSEHGVAVKHSTTTGWAPTCDCPQGGVSPCIVLDPFFGSGTTGLVAKRLGRDFIGCELNPAYVEIAQRRLSPAMNHRIDEATWGAEA